MQDEVPIREQRLEHAFLTFKSACRCRKLAVFERGQYLRLARDAHNRAIQNALVIQRERLVIKGLARTRGD